MKASRLALALVAFASAAHAQSLPLDSLPITARIDAASSPDWIALAFGSAWVVNYKPDRVTRIDLASNRVVADIPIGPNGCLGVLADEHSLWVPTCGDGMINEIDPTSNTIARRIPAPIKRGREGSFALLGGSFWIPANASDSSSSSIVRIDARTGQTLATIAVGPRSDVAVAGFGAVWVASSASDSVLRIDPATNTVVARIAVGRSPKFMAAGEGAVWVQNRADGSVSRVDPRTNREAARIEAHVPTKWGDIAVGDGAVWVSVDGTPVTRIDPRTNQVTHQFHGGSGADAIRAGGGSAWVADHQHGTVWRIDVRRLPPAR